MAATLVRTDTGAAASNQVVIPTGAAYAAGTSIIVIVAFRPSGDSDNLHYRVNDPTNGEYSADVLSYAPNNGGVAIFSKHNISGLTSGTNITVRMGDTGNKVAAMVMNWSGLETSSVLDKTSVNPSQGTNSPSAPTYTSNATATTSQAAELLIGGILLHTDVTTGVTPTTSWTAVQTNGVGTSGGSAGSNAVVWGQYRAVAATGGYTSNPTGTTRNYRSAIATYKVAAGGGGGGTPSNQGNWLAFF